MHQEVCQAICPANFYMIHHQNQSVASMLGQPYTDVLPVCIQSGVGFYCPARKETEGVAKAVLKETGTAER